MGIGGKEKADKDLITVEIQEKPAKIKDNQPFLHH